jgi:uncharacterized protein DUF2505
VRFQAVQQHQAPLLVVEATFVDPGFLRELATLPKLGRPELLDQDDQGDRLRQRVRYAFVGDLSAAVRAVVDPARLTWVEDSTLDRRSHLTTFTILPDNYARLLNASGSISLTAQDDGQATVRRIDGQVTVPMPLVGRKVEAAIVSGLREHAEREVDVVHRWVSSRS